MNASWFPSMTDPAQEDLLPGADCPPNAGTNAKPTSSVVNAGKIHRSTQNDLHFESYIFSVHFKE